jgi:hypothetical protein
LSIEKSFINFYRYFYKVFCGISVSEQIVLQIGNELGAHLYERQAAVYRRERATPERTAPEALSPALAR